MTSELHWRFWRSPCATDVRRHTSCTSSFLFCCSQLVQLAAYWQCIFLSSAFYFLQLEAPRSQAAQFSHPPRWKTSYSFNVQMNGIFQEIRTLISMKEENREVPILDLDFVSRTFSHFFLRPATRQTWRAGLFFCIKDTRNSGSSRTAGTCSEAVDRWPLSTVNAWSDDRGRQFASCVWTDKYLSATTSFECCHKLSHRDFDVELGLDPVEFRQRRAKVLDSLINLSGKGTRRENITEVGSAFTEKV